MRLFCSIAFRVCVCLVLAGTAQAQTQTKPKCFGGPPPPPGLVAWWPFDESSGSNAKDVVSGLDGQIMFNGSGKPFGNGKVAGAYHFGKHDHMDMVVVPHDPKLNFDATTDFTIDAWISLSPVGFKQRDTQDELKTYVLILIFEKVDAGTGDPGYKFLFDQLKSQLFFGMWGAGTSTTMETVTPISFLPKNKNWAHVAVRVSRSGGSSVPAGVTFFVNGLPVAGKHTGSTTLTYDLSNNGDATMGDTPTDFYLDEVEVFRRALKNDEIARIYSRGKCKPFAGFPTGPDELGGFDGKERTCIDPPPGLDAWYPLDGDGTELVHGNNAVPVGSVSFSPGKVGKALNAQSGYMKVPHAPIVNQGVGDFSIDAWVKFQPQSDSLARHIIEKRLASAQRGYIVYVWKNRFGLQLADGNHTNRNDPRHVTDGEWHHLAVTVDRDNLQGIIFYVDGVPGDTRDPTTRQGNLDNNEPLTIGLENFNVQLDEVEFFDRVLMPTEIQAIFNAGSIGKCRP